MRIAVLGVRMRFAMATVLSLACLAAVSASQGRVTLDATAIDEAVTSAVGTSGLPFAVVSVTGPDRVLHQRAAGTDRDSIFRIYSMTKPVTSVAVMMLVEEGRIGLDDPVAKHLPAFENRQVMTRIDAAAGTFETAPPRTTLTIRHLLANTSGIGYAFSNRTAQLLQKAGKGETEGPLAHEPGTKWTYGPNTKVLGDIIEKVSGSGLEAFFTTRIFQRLGMKDTFFTVPTAKAARVVNTNQRKGEAIVSVPNPTTFTPQVRGDYGLFSTAADYSAFLRMLLSDGGKLLRPATVRAMTTNQIAAVNVEQQPALMPSLSLAFPDLRGKDKFGLGFHIVMPETPAPGWRPAGSYGWSGAANTHFWVDPVNRIGVVVLAQLMPFYDPAAVTLLNAIERAIYQPMASPSFRGSDPPISTPLRGSIRMP